MNPPNTPEPVLTRLRFHTPRLFVGGMSMRGEMEYPLGDWQDLIADLRASKAKIAFQDRKAGIIEVLVDPIPFFSRYLGTETCTNERLALDPVSPEAT